MTWLDAIGGAATVLAMWGVLLNNWRVRWCFAVWLVSNGLTLWLHCRAGAGAEWKNGMMPLAMRDLAFLILAVHDWWAWRPKRGGAE